MVIGRSFAPPLIRNRCYSPNTYLSRSRFAAPLRIPASATWDWLQLSVVNALGLASAKILGKEAAGLETGAVRMACTVATAARLGLGLWGARTMQARSYNLDSRQFSTLGGEGGGSIRDAGGAFSRREKAEEERYFREKNKEQLAALRKYHQEEISHHEKEIQRLQKEIERHKGKIKHLKHDD
uniref:ATPase inhibitor, mitochondrial n=2 Tax=Monodelphis domestica TaxID=13616 RepID=F7BE70_MONDO